MNKYNDSVKEDAEKMVQCPYNKSHVVLKSRYAKHLLKCKRSYTGPEMKTCPLNITHILTDSEYADHVANCPDRLFIEQHVESFGSMKRKADDDGDEKEKEVAPADDDDDEWATGSSDIPAITLEERKKRCLESNKVVHHQHKTPSERKADKLERHRRILEDELLKHSSDASDE